MGVTLFPASLLPLSLDLEASLFGVVMHLNAHLGAARFQFYVWCRRETDDGETRIRGP